MAKHTDTPRLGERFEEALVFAATLHRHQIRKGTEVPYVVHLLAVANLVIEHGGDEDEAIAALLHDAVEDQGGDATLDRIRRRFGPRVADIVEACSDTAESPKPPWRERKERYLAHLRAEGRGSVLLVSIADKLHNINSTLTDLRTLGPSIWRRFTAGRDGSLWYYRQLVDAYREAPGSPRIAGLIERLDALVTKLEGTCRRC